MDRRQELKNAYKEIKTEAGIYQILNKVNGKRFIGSTTNLKRLNGKRMELDMGGNRNKQLQQEWTECGGDQFVMEVLEVWEKKEGDFTSPKDALRRLEDKWLEQLQPYGEKGYHKKKP